MAHLGTRSLLLCVDGTDRTGEVSRAVVTSAPVVDGLIDWHGLPVGPRRHSLAMILAQDAANGSLWALAWNRPGEQVAFHLAPYGNPLADALQPHYSGWVQIAQPDGDVLGGDASPSRRSVMTLQMVWPVVGDVDQLVAGEAYPADLPEGW